MSWRDGILDEFVQGVSKLTLVADPDGLLLEEKLVLHLQKKGFDLLEFQDPIQFRYAYEMNYRSIWDQGNTTDLVVILRVQDSELDNLPFDLLQCGRKLRFDLGSLFPALSYPVIELLSFQYLDDLFNAQQKYKPNMLGDNGTRDFILLHVFGIAGELIQTPVDLLRCLLRCHYQGLQLSSDLWERLIYVLQQNGSFATWPLTDIVPDAEEFFAFLQERWPFFLASLDEKDKDNCVQEVKQLFGLNYCGPEKLPFGHHDILIYIDNLFLEGKLAPIPWEKPITGNDWAMVGLVTDKNHNFYNRISKLQAVLEKELPEEDCRYSAWLSFSQKFAGLKQMMESMESYHAPEEFHKLTTVIEQRFTDWLRHHYGSLINLPPLSPAMVHHVPRHIARNFEEENIPVALIVVDGLSLSQWGTIRQILHDQDPDNRLVIRESATFAWIPTLTSVSRQAIFSGSPPFYFPSSVDSTGREPKLWQKFWEGYGVSKREISYQKGLGDGDGAQSIQDFVGRAKVLGLVVDKIDKIMHGMQLGSSGMHNQIDQWCRKGFLSSLIDCLLNENYHIWLTSDHGNIECSGIGSPLEGAIAETRGERVRIYPSEELRTSMVTKLSQSLSWNPVGLPANYFPLIAGGDSAFVQKGKTLVGHGGISIEEVIVPLVKFERRGK